MYVYKPLIICLLDLQSLLAPCFLYRAKAKDTSQTGTHCAVDTL